MNTNCLWFVEVKLNKQYVPYQAEVSRDGARALQRYLKSTTVAVPSRIRKYAQDPYSRG